MGRGRSSVLWGASAADPTTKWTTDRRPQGSVQEGAVCLTANRLVRAPEGISSSTKPILTRRGIEASKEN